MIGLEKLYQNGFYTQKIVRICGKRKSVWHQYWRISYLIYKSFINLFIYMYSQKRFYVSSIVLINHEMLMLHNENCILTLSVVIYILLVTSKNMLMKMCSAIESFYIYISFVKKKKKLDCWNSQSINQKINCSTTAKNQVTKYSTYLQLFAELFNFLLSCLIN